MLEGFRIIEFEGIGPAPFAAMMLADLGAEVIVVQRPRSANPTVGEMTLLDRGNRAILLDRLPAAGFNRLAPADGAFYVYADVTPLTNDSPEFCKRMLEEAGVAATPGLDFDPRRGNAFVRFSFAGTPEEMEEAAARLEAWRR